VSQFWRAFIFVAGIVVAIGLFGSVGTTTYWVGQTDLQIEFVVTDADTRRPIGGATVHVHSELGFCLEKDGQDFTMKTDAEGRIIRLYHHCMSGGRESWIRKTWGVSLPLWMFHATAPGFADGEKIDLRARYHRQVRRGDGGPATLVVPIALRKQVR
jgi:hypothetical protein